MLSLIIRAFVCLNWWTGDEKQRPTPLISTTISAKTQHSKQNATGNRDICCFSSPGVIVFRPPATPASFILNNVDAILFVFSERRVSAANKQDLNSHDNDLVAMMVLEALVAMTVCVSHRCTRSSVIFNHRDAETAKAMFPRQ